MTPQPELVLPYVVRIERTDPPTRTDALEAAARGVLLMLTRPPPEWVDGGPGLGRPAHPQGRAAGAGSGVAASRGLARSHSAQWLGRGARLPANSGRRMAARPGPAAGRRHGTRRSDARPGQGAALRSSCYRRTSSSRPEKRWPKRRTPHSSGGGRPASPTGPLGRARTSTLPSARRRQRRGAGRSAAGVPVVHDAGFTEVAPDSQTAAVVLPWLVSP